MTAMALFLCSTPLPTSLPTLSAKSHLSHKPQSLVPPLSRRPASLFLARAGDNVVTATVEEEKEAEEKAVAAAGGKMTSDKPEKKETLGANGVAAAAAGVPKFADNRWANGTWDLLQFKKGGKTDWDAVIEAEARRRKWLEDNPESSTNEDPVIFDTSIIPWWAWIKRYHLPEAEVLNGRAAMIGFFMAYFVDSLTGAGLVDQMDNFFCKTLLFVAVTGVLLIRKNEDIEKLKKLFDETTFYDKQWKATWLDDNTKDASK